MYIYIIIYIYIYIYIYIHGHIKITYIYCVKRSTFQLTLNSYAKIKRKKTTIFI